MACKNEAQKRLILFGRALSVVCVLLIFSNCVSPGVYAQGDQPRAVPTPQTQDNQEIGEYDVISVSTSEVMLPVTVRDPGGQFVTTLTFNIYISGLSPNDLCWLL